MKVRVLRLNQIKKRNEREIMRLKRSLTRDEDVIDSLQTIRKKMNPHSKTIDSAPESSTVKIRHNILNAVEEALGGT